MPRGCECKVFYEPTALARCREGSIILLRLCAALEAFDVAIDSDQSALNSAPRWPILEEEDEWDRRAQAAATAATAATAASTTTGGSSYSRAPSHNSFGQGQAAAGVPRAASASASASASAPPPQEEFGSLSWFQQQRQRQKQEAAAGRSDSGGWAASALSEIDQV